MRLFYDNFLFILESRQGSEDLLGLWEDEAAWSLQHDVPLLAVAWVSQMALALADYIRDQTNPSRHLHITLASIVDLLNDYMTGLYMN